MNQSPSLCSEMIVDVKEEYPCLACDALFSQYRRQQDMLLMFGVFEYLLVSIVEKNIARKSIFKSTAACNKEKENGVFHAMKYETNPTPQKKRKQKKEKSNS